MKASKGAYGLLNLTASVQSKDGRWTITGFGENLLDKFFITHEVTYVERNVTYGDIAIGDPRNVWRNGNEDILRRRLG